MTGMTAYTKRFRSRSEQKAAEAERAGAGGAGVDVGQLEILKLLEKLDGIPYDASSGEASDEELVQKTRMIEMETSKKTGVYAKVPLEDCWKDTGKKPLGVKRADVNKGDAKHPEYRSRVVAKETERYKTEGMFARHRRWRQRRCCYH